ncbi:hypothetical protein I3760_11G186700 [Carya illinoinensis]|uniref:Cytochrome b561 and DOMON domain-containing protein n=1 Tax=Carya illinoinensis TaxID=32201 RepID=A0A8T1P9J5_CARIL|nr:cytochrome b561 and DOMON domain-containing protein At5g35735-like [Carya illinoinensis]KAG2682334.1 hypothetical protein I3760_11G186700 [Carya illinoinensis]KAG6637647.1 hypothetical protein CIPAW_11G192400 [Carya illinoinensis]KAG6689740.1 hypothetical protein I3842_11G189500 [Carya illinoinensis]
MYSSTKPVTPTISLAFFSLLFSVAQSSCSLHFFEMAKTINITQCKKLTTLGAEFGWSVSGANSNETRIDIILGASLHSETGWLAWGVNPGKMPQMVGTRAIIGIRQQNESLVINTYNITRDTKLGCQLLPTENIDVKFSRMGVNYVGEKRYMIINATLYLPHQDYNVSKLSHVWQVGHHAEGWQPMMHAASLQNVDSTETLNMTSGNARSVGKHRHHLRHVHGILNIVGWGVMLPIGVIVARYCRIYPFNIGDDTWFYLHVSCQIAGYVIGTTAWGIGLGLGHSSRHYTFRTHRLLGIFIFTFATLQILALRLKPKPDDDYRKHWNMYHHLLGYLLLAGISVNIFQGINILDHDGTWKWGYIGVLVAFAAIILGLEIYTWKKFISDHRQQSRKDSQDNAGPNPVGTSPNTKGGTR